MSDNVRDWLSAGIFGAPKRKKEEETDLKRTGCAKKSAPRRAHALVAIALCLLALHFCFERRERFLLGGIHILRVAIFAVWAKACAPYNCLCAFRAFFTSDQVVFCRRNSIYNSTDSHRHSPTFPLLTSGS